MSAKRVLIWSGDRLFCATASNYLSRRIFEVVEFVEASKIPSLELPAELLIADLDTLLPNWSRSISMLRTIDMSLALILVSSRWPNFARLHAWRPSGYVRKPFAMDDLLRVVRDLVPAVQASHRSTPDLDRPSPVTPPDAELEKIVAESAA